MEIFFRGTQYFDKCIAGLLQNAEIYIYWSAGEKNTSGSQRMVVNVPPVYLVLDFLL
jgi:hypothetical protein